MELKLHDVYQKKLATRAGENCPLHTVLDVCNIKGDCCMVRLRYSGAPKSQK